MSSEEYIKQRHLEEAVGFITAQNQSLAKTAAKQQFEVESLTLEVEAQRSRGADLQAQLDVSKALFDRAKKLEFDIHKTRGERDFHAKQHADTKARLKASKSNEFQLASVRKELANKTAEVEALQAKVAKARFDIESLLVLGERPVDAGLANGAPVETFYARKIATLEEAVARQSAENAALEAKVRSAQRAAENGGASKSDGTRELQVENESLRLKVEEGRRDNQTLREELERAKSELAAASAVPQEDPSAVRAQFQAALQKAVKESELLKQESLRLAAAGRTRKLGDLAGPDLVQKLTNVGVEKRVMQQKVDDLRRTLDFKNIQIETLRAESPDTDALQQLIEANKRMSAEIFRLQEQLRTIDQMSKDSFHN